MKKSTIVLIVLCLLTFLLAFFSIRLSVDRSVKAIEAIGEVHYGEDCRALIDKATEDYRALDPNPRLNLRDRIKGVETLEAAQKEYARLAIKAAAIADKRKAVEKYTDEDVKAFIDEAREVCENYFESEEAMSEVENYSELLTLEAKYDPEAAGSAPAAPASDTAAVPMC